MRLFRRDPVRRRHVGEQAPPPVDTRPTWGEVGIHGVARAREWDSVVLVAAELRGERIAFVALADRSLVLDDGPDDVEELAEAVERSLAPPYRAEAVRRPDGTWAVGASAIDVVDLPGLDGDDVTISVGPEGRDVVVDGESRPGTVPELDGFLRGRQGLVHARRLAGHTFELSVRSL
jgi:hypothetical protein